MRVPPITTILGQACYACFKGDIEGVSLRKCTKCRSVQYCSVECQNGDWKSHKSICKALYQLEHDVSSKGSFADLPTTPYPRLQMLDMDIQAVVSIQIRYLESILKRDLTIPERNIICWEPRCMGCGRSDRILRMEAEENENVSATVTLTPCGACKMAFYCSQSHWDAVKHHHVRGACEDGYDGLTHCQMSQEIQQDVVFANMMAPASPMEFSWAPEHIKPSWESLKNKSWDSEYASGIMEAFSVPAAMVGPFLRGASVALSMPMTILYALERLNTDDQWTRKKTLTIHVLGAFQIEIHHASMFEEILHRLPELKTLELVLCGPELSRLISSNKIRHDFDMETCPHCAILNRKRVHHLAIQTYHEYAKSFGDKFTKPDLAIAFNSGLSEEMSSWKDTISFLVKNKIPSVFTAYNREEAEAEARILFEAGANLVPELGPTRNTWRSISFKKEPQRVTGFYSVNGWLAGGFQ